MNRRRFGLVAATRVATMGAGVRISKRAYADEPADTDISPASHLKLTGWLHPSASYPQYTRLSGPKSPGSRYVEVLTQVVGNPSSEPLSQRVYQTVDIYVPNWTTLYFSDYSTPSPPSSIVTIGSSFRNVGTSLPTGFVGLDGSPLSVSGKELGPIVGLSGEDKNGDRYTLSTQVGSVQAQGRVLPNATWVYSKASFAVNQNQPIVIGMSYCPSDLLVYIYIIHQNVTSLLHINLASTVTDASGHTGIAAITRSVTYHNDSYSSQILDVPGSNGNPGIYLAMPPIKAFAYPVEFLSPGLSYIRNQLQVPPLQSRSALAALGAIDPTVTQPEAQFVAQAMNLATAALAPLASSFATPYTLGPGDALYWLGSMFTFGSGKQILQNAFSSLYTDYIAWAKKQGAGGAKVGPWRYMLSSSPDQAPAQQAVDKILGG